MTLGGLLATGFAALYLGIEKVVNLEDFMPQQCRQLFTVLKPGKTVLFSWMSLAIKWPVFPRFRQLGGRKQGFPRFSPEIFFLLAAVMQAGG